MTKFSLVELEKCTFLQASSESCLTNGFHRYYKSGQPLLLQNGAELLQIEHTVIALYAKGAKTLLLHCNKLSFDVTKPLIDHPIIFSQLDF